MLLPVGRREPRRFGNPGAPHGFPQWLCAIALVAIVAAPAALADPAPPHGHAHRLAMSRARPYLDLAVLRIAANPHVAQLADETASCSQNVYGGTTCAQQVTVGLRNGSVYGCLRKGRLRIDCPAEVYESAGALAGPVLASATISTKLTRRHGVHLTWWWNE